MSKCSQKTYLEEEKPQGAEQQGLGLWKHFNRSTDGRSTIFFIILGQVYYISYLYIIQLGHISTAVPMQTPFYDIVYI